jgi:hypothetical protein
LRSIEAHRRLWHLAFLSAVTFATTSVEPAVTEAIQWQSESSFRICE